MISVGVEMRPPRISSLAAYMFPKAIYLGNVEVLKTLNLQAYYPMHLCHIAIAIDGNSFGLGMERRPLRLEVLVGLVQAIAFQPTTRQFLAIFSH